MNQEDATDVLAEQPCSANTETPLADEVDAMSLIELVLAQQPVSSCPQSSENVIDHQVIEERHVFSARREIVLRCGKASITLTRSGKVIIRGTQVSTHATGTNRIKGGSVRIN